MNLPNKLTMLRIATVPVLVIIYLGLSPTIMVINRSTQLSLRDVIVCALFILSSFTDFLDGQIARRNNLVTSFGKFMDPLADKLLVNTILILLVYTRQADIIPVLLMSARDLFVDGLRLVAASAGEVVSAGIFGKAKTVLQMVAIIALLLRLSFSPVLLWLAAVMSLYSGAVYFKQLRHYVFKSI